jgi:hypothetical protein
MKGDHLLQEYASFHINNEGALEGVGMFISLDHDLGLLVNCLGLLQRISFNTEAQIMQKINFPFENLWSFCQNYDA